MGANLPALSGAQRRRGRGKVQTKPLGVISPKPSSLESSERERNLPTDRPTDQRCSARRSTKNKKFQVAGGLGFEPRLAESESAVLPLDDPPSDAPLESGPVARWMDSI